MGRSRPRCSGQATVEAVAGVAVLLFAGLVAFQLLLVGHAHQLAEGAAQAGAVAVVRGEPASAAVEDALPEWASRRYSLGRLPGAVRVSVRPPSPVGRISRLLEVSSTAWVREAPR
ncbi:MAG: hypothetical protein FGM38_04595 [Solirubrobacterales bacterium]|nr:hypothetical protein [Solirubrobacterales bacterium]